MADAKEFTIRNEIWRRYGHLIVLAALYSLIGGIGFAFVDATRGYSIAVTTPLIVASLVIIASWTVFGPSRIWVSFLVGQLFGIAIALVCAIGFFISFMRAADGEFFLVLVTALFIVPTATVAAQIPLWIFRGFFGWRFTYRNESTTSSLSLRDLFLITFVFAIAVTAPQYPASLMAANSVRGIEVGNNTFVQTTLDDGSTSFRETKISAANVEQLRADARKQATGMFNQVALTYSAIISIISLLAVPCLWFVFRIRNPAIAFFSNVTYAAIFYILVAAIYAMTNGMKFFFYQASLWTLIVIGGSLVGLVLPMAISKRCGFRLTTPRDRVPTV